MEIELKIITHPDFDYEFEMASVCKQAGNIAIAESHLLRAIQVSETEFGSGHVTTALALEQLAELQEKHRRDSTKACELYQTALEILQQELPADNALLLRCAFGLARTKGELNAHNDAEKLYRSIFVDFRRTFGPESLEAASLYSHYSELLDAIGDHDHSMILGELAGEIWQNNGLLGNITRIKKSQRPMPGGDDTVAAPKVVAKSLTYLKFANIARGSKDAKEAERLFLLSLKHAKQDFGKSDQGYLDVLNQVIDFYKNDLNQMVTAVDVEQKSFSQ